MDFDFTRFEFSPVIHLPAKFEIYDFSLGYDPERYRSYAYGVGRYNERRPGMYSTEIFHGRGKPRDIHVGIDIAAPVGTPVHAFYSGRILATGINAAKGDYGGTIITEHRLHDHWIWALHGHLSHESTVVRSAGECFTRGDVIAWVGDEAENGGWNPHLHFQLSWLKPERCDMPGAVNENDLAMALETYPDPRLVLGALY
jgi:murein DD-endopeptidase MepM/ murein hydrolase activator NlpD